MSYLNSAYMGPLSHAVMRAGGIGLERKAHPWTITSPDFFEPVEQARNLFAQIVDADADGVAILPAASYGIAIAARNLRCTEGQRVVVLHEQFPSNVYAWRELAASVGADVVTVHKPETDDWTPAILAAIDERTAIVALPNCHWTDGSLLDLVAIGQRSREAGAALVIDGTQSIGAMPFDIETIRPDFVVTALYKWLLGPYSAAFMWCAPQHREGHPIEQSWITRRGSGDFPHLVDYQRDYRPGARRYDVGETSNFALMPAIIAAFEQTLKWGVENIASYIETLTRDVAARSTERGFSVAPSDLRAPHFLGVRLHGADPEAVATALAGAEVYVSVRGDAMRVSPHVYNDTVDVDRLFEVLDRNL